MMFFWKHYRSSVFLFAGLIVGSTSGFFLKENAVILKPLGDVFLNLLFTSVVPLVFFSMSSAVAGIRDTRRLGRILSAMMGVFIVTGIIASLWMVAGVLLFQPANDLSFTLSMPADSQPVSVAERLVNAFTVNDFGDLLSRRNMLALIIFSVLIGLAVSSLGEKASAFRQWLMSGNEVMMKVVGFIMMYAPIGLGAYFAYLVGVFGPQLLGTYSHAVILYYPLSFIYFFIAFTFYVYIAGGWPVVKTFWSSIIPTALTALGTGSSVASIPANLQAAKKMKVPDDIYEVVIPMGSTIHMEGSCLAAVLKIAVLFGVFGMDFHGVETVLIAVGIALLSGTVMSGIPGGGFLGEIMIVALYGFPPEALPVAAMIGTLVDPPATMVNAVGDNVSSMLVARVLGGKKWMVSHES